MKKPYQINYIFTLMLCAIICNAAKAQDKAAIVPGPKPYGVIDTTDLKLKSCDFEKDASAEILFDVAEVKVDYLGNVTLLRHIRLKIFNEKGEDEANAKIKYLNRFDHVADFKAETINLNGKAITYTPVDDNLFYKQKIDKNVKALDFTFPNVKPGSVIEVQYKLKLIYHIPDWSFQEDIPTRYSEISIEIPKDKYVEIVPKVNQPFFKDIDTNVAFNEGYVNRHIVKALTNISSSIQEPYMAPEYNNSQSLLFNPEVWYAVCHALEDNAHFGEQLNDTLTGEKGILAKVKAIKLSKADSVTNKNIKIDSIFNIVKNRMAWDNTNRFFTVDGTQKAWDKKTGNSTEINLILYHLLTQAGIEAYPMLVSTPGYGSVNPNDPNIFQFNKTIVYIRIDSLTHYMLDATDKYNTYNHIPFDVLGTYGFAISPKDNGNCTLLIQSTEPAQQYVYINADIKSTGQLSGTADITDGTYQKADNINLYKGLGEKEYIDQLRGNDNNLAISSLKMEDMDDDTLPLTQHLDFTLALTASDENYIYFNPNLFTSFGTNPFLTEKRYSNINFKYTANYIIYGVYKIPPGYKIENLPKNEVLRAEDKSMSFKRIVGEQDGSVFVRYTINRNRSYYKKEEYPALYKFYKQMFEMLNEQIVLKKS